MARAPRAPYPRLAADTPFWLNVDRSAGPDACWPWTGVTVTRGGYGVFHGDGTSELAHRFAFMLAHGPLAVGMNVLHRCDNPPCCNERHLFDGTQADNMLDMAAKGRSFHARKTTCPQGHPYDRVDPRGGRYCHLCNRAAGRRFEERARARRASES